MAFAGERKVQVLPRVNINQKEAPRTVAVLAVCLV